MKKFLSFILVLCMLAIETAAFAYEYTQPVEENASMEDKNAKFLLDDNAAVSALTSTHNLIAPSGWDIDRRGGSFTSLRTAYYIIKDTSDCYPVSASYNFDKQISGQFTFETYLYFNTCEDGFYIEFTDDENNAPVKLYIEKGEWCSGGKKLAACEENVDQRIRTMALITDFSILQAERKDIIYSISRRF